MGKRNYEEEFIKAEKKANRMALVFYTFIIIIIGFFVFNNYIDKYQFYVVDKEVTMSVGSDYQVNLLPKYYDNYNFSDYVFSSDDESVATVDEYGKITALKSGTTNINVRNKKVFETKKMVVNVDTLEITSISISKNNNKEIDVQKNKTIKIVPSINGNDKIKTKVKYTSSNESIAKIDDFGNLTPINEGTVIVSVENEEGIKDEVKVNVIATDTEIRSLSFKDQIIYLKKNDTQRLILDVEPSNASIKDVKWTSSDSSIAKVDQDGKVTVLKEGVATIKATTKNNISANIIINVDEELSISETNITIEAGESFTLKSNKKVKWTSSNPKAAIVDTFGNILGYGEGTAIISATYNNQTVKCTVKVINKNVEVNNVLINKNNIILYVGDTHKLSAIISPSNATNKGVKWSSSDSSIVSVDNSGFLTAKKKGSATITVQTNNGKKATSTIKVVEKSEQSTDTLVTSINLNASSKDLFVNDTFKLSHTIVPSNASNKSVTWKSSNTNVATVDQNGNVKAISVGKATITVTSSNNISTTCVINVSEKNIEVQSISVNKTNVELYVDESINIAATINPSNATNKKVAWTSSSPNVADVDQNGKVTAKSSGKTTITVKTDNGKKAEITIVVKDNIINATSLQLDKESAILYEKDIMYLKATILPSNATNKSITWSSDDSLVADVDQNGKVTAKKNGSATITAKSGNLSSKCIITVRKQEAVNTQVEEIIMNISDTIIYINDTISLSADIKPLNASNKTITWSSSNTSVAEVNQNGKVTAKNEGQAIITASVDSKKTTCIITVRKKEVAVTGVYLNYSELELEKGASIELSHTIKPQNASDTNVTWKSSNTNIATVNKYGKVVAKNSGTTTITVTTSNGKSASCIVTVKGSKEIELTKISFSETSGTLNVNETIQLTPIFTPADATNKSVTWSSSNINIATVSNAGLVKAIKAGSAIITASALNGVKATYTLTVKDDSNSYSHTDTSSTYVSPVSTGFEITYYWGIRADLLTEADVENMSKAGITLAQLKSYHDNNVKLEEYRNSMTRAIKLLEKKHIKVLVTDMMNLYSNFANATKFSDERAMSSIKDTVSYYSQFSNVIGYDICDEPSTLVLNRLQKVVNYIKENDPKRIAYINLLPSYASEYQLFGKGSTTTIPTLSTFNSNYLGEFASKVKPHFLSVDHYPQFLAGKDVKKSKEIYYNDLNKVRQLASSNGLKPMMISLVTQHDSYKNLSREEIAYQISTSLAFGMKRISYFTYSVDDAPGFNNAIVSSSHSTTEHYKDVKAINSWAKPLGDILYAKTLSGVYGINEIGLSDYNSSNKIFGGIEATDFNVNRDAPTIVSVFSDNTVMIVNTDLSGYQSNIKFVGSAIPLSELQWYNPELKKWVDITAANGDNAGTVWLDPGTKTITLRSGYPVLLKKK